MTALTRTTLPLVRPRALIPGDTIAVIAPSGRVDPARLADGVRMLQGWGFQVRCLPSTASGRAYLAGESDRANGEELTAAFADQAIAAVLCAKGGYGSMRVLPHIDWEVVRANPKPFGGYSDITALHQAFRRETGQVTLHATMVARQGDEPGAHPWTAEALRRALTSAAPLGTITPPPENPPLTAVLPGSAEGALAGGNLTLVASLAGTRWQLDARGCILVLEDVDEKPYRVDRMLTQLAFAGVLDGVLGVLFGDSPTCDRPADDERSFSLQQILADRFGPLGVPVLYGFPCGHTPYRAALPLGVDARLDADQGTLELLAPACVPAAAPVR